MMRWLIVLLAACSHTCPPCAKPAPPPPVTAIAEPLACDLPKWPQRPVVHTVNQNGGVLASIYEWTLVVAYTLNAEAWHDAASGCISAAPK